MTGSQPIPGCADLPLPPFEERRERRYGGIMGNRLRPVRAAVTLRLSASQRRFLGVRVAADDPEPPRKARSVNDQLDVNVHDTQVLDEIEMMTNLIIATSETDGPLSQGEIDTILGVEEDAPAPLSAVLRPSVGPTARELRERDGHPLALP